MQHIPNTSSKARILIVDDTPMNIELLGNVLRDEYSILVAVNGKTALKIAQKDPRPDLILLDIMMPDMDGYEVLHRLQDDPATAHIPVIFVTAKAENLDEGKGFSLGAVDYINKPFSIPILKARLRTHLALRNQKDYLETLVKARTEEICENKIALQKALKNLQTTKVTTGVFWVQVPEAHLNILCGCPADVVKHLMVKGYNSQEIKDGITFETGQNVILLSDALVQNGKFSNLSEFPVLQMLYRQGMIIPNHPNNTGIKPMIIGKKEQVEAQLAYIFRGNYGLISEDEMMQAGISEDQAHELMKVKMKFAFGKIQSTEDFLDYRFVNKDWIEIRNDVFVRNIGFNRYEFRYNNKTTEVDLNLAKHETYESPYPLGYYHIEREFFAVIHSGEGDGWSTEKQCMGSILMFQGNIYLIDASPNIREVLLSFGIDISEVAGIFHTHAHDDHFSGLPALMMSDHKIKYFATPLVRASVAKKFSALMSMEECQFSEFFDVHDLAFDQWNDCDGLEVKPVYSPHPVENNMFIFRALSESGYKTYAHWADTVSFDVLDTMQAQNENDQQGISAASIQKIKDDYLTKVNLKKIDIGAGMIHGRVEDFKQDTSDRIITAHTSEPLTIEQRQIGSQVSFGSVNVFIKAQQNYARKAAYHHLKVFLPDLPEHEIKSLLNTPMVALNSGSILLKNGVIPDFIYLIISGSVEYIQAETNTRNQLSVGSLIGEQAILTNVCTQGVWRSVSQIQLLKIPASLFLGYISKNKLYDEMCHVVDRILFLQSSDLLGENVSYHFQYEIARIMQMIEVKQAINFSDQPEIFLIKDGCVSCLNASGDTVEELTTGMYFGEHTFLKNTQVDYRYQATTPTTLYRITDYPLLDKPVMYMKLFAMHEKRKNLCS